LSQSDAISLRKTPILHKIFYKLMFQPVSLRLQANQACCNCERRGERADMSRRFTDRSIQALKPKQRRHAGEKGLYIEASGSGKTNRWILRYTRANGAVTEMGGKTYPDVTLEKARDWAKKMRQVSIPRQSRGL
jgi:hypothetical protein